MFRTLAFVACFTAVAAFAHAGQPRPTAVGPVDAQQPPPPSTPQAVVPVPMVPGMMAPAPAPGAIFGDPAQQPPPGRPPTAPAPTPMIPGPVMPTPPMTAPPASVPGPIDIARRARGKDINIQIEITITDQTGSGAPEKKVVSLMAADQTMGRVRANANVRRGDLTFVGSNLNVDARPMILESDRVLLELTLEYTPLRDTNPQSSANPNAPTSLNESISVILQNGKPLTISQAADPISDRRMTVDVKATIVK